MCSLCIFVDYTVEIAVLAGVVAMALIAVFLVALTLVGIYCRRKVIKRKRGETDMCQ